MFEEENFFTAKELINKSELPERTVRYALKNLRDHGLIKEKLDWNDMRQKKFTLKVFI